MELGKGCESMDIRGMIRQMTLEEKAGLCSGQDFWRLKAVERLGLPNVMVSDGPHGLRKQDQKGDHLGLNESIPAVCFPTGAALACSAPLPLPITALMSLVSNISIISPTNTVPIPSTITNAELMFSNVLLLPSFYYQNALNNN